MEKVGEETAARGAAVVKDDDVPDLEGDFEEVAKVEEQASKVNILEWNFIGLKINSAWQRKIILFTVEN